MYSGAVSFPLRAGPVAIVSQSGELPQRIFGAHELPSAGIPLCDLLWQCVGHDGRGSVSCLVDNSEVEVIAGIIESLTKPQLLFDAAQRARERRKSIVFFQPGRSEVGQAMIRSHTGALVRDSEVLAAFLRRCGIVQIESYDTFIETIELLGWRRGTTSSRANSLSSLAAAAAPPLLPTHWMAQTYRSLSLPRKRWNASAQQCPTSVASTTRSTARAPFMTIPICCPHSWRRWWQIRATQLLLARSVRVQAPSRCSELPVLSRIPPRPRVAPLLCSSQGAPWWTAQARARAAAQ